ncbi:hypothetical protein [Brevibacillus laterosporus]|uniref:hypothetical protein n=1 Tax=Brevibacillus laterosporus TaxID=1465 RepID=UPI0024062E6D|nr:hypothetical protein [Brevibacillus laterosporus]
MAKLQWNQGLLELRQVQCMLLFGKIPMSDRSSVIKENSSNKSDLVDFRNAVDGE